MNLRLNKTFLSIISIPILLNPAISSSTPSANHDVELHLDSLEQQVRGGLETCIETFEEETIPWYAFRDALDELNEYGTMLSAFQPQALENYGVNLEEHICYITNQNAIRLNTRFFGEEPIYVFKNN